MLSFLILDREFTPYAATFPTQLLGGETYSGEIVIVLERDGTGTFDVRSVPSNGWIENKAAKRGVEIEWTARGARDTWVRTNNDEIMKMIFEIGPLLERVHAGHNVFEDAVSSGGTLDDDAQEAADEIQEIIECSEWWTEDGVADAVEWLEEIQWEGVPLSLDSTSEDLKQMVDQIERRALKDGILLHDVFHALKSKIYELEEEAERTPV